jgi:hypothetical protein
MPLFLVSIKGPVGLKEFYTIEMSLFSANWVIVYIIRLTFHSHGLTYHKCPHGCLEWAWVTHKDTHMAHMNIMIILNKWTWGVTWYWKTQVYWRHFFALLGVIFCLDFGPFFIFLLLFSCRVFFFYLFIEGKPHKKAPPPS